MSAATATIAFRVKPEIKRRADRLFERLGMSTSTGMNVLLMQTLAHRGFAAPVALAEEAIPNETPRKAIADLESGQNLSRYESVDDMLKDLP